MVDTDLGIVYSPKMTLFQCNDRHCLRIVLSVMSTCGILVYVWVLVCAHDKLVNVRKAEQYELVRTYKKRYHAILTPRRK